MNLTKGNNLYNGFLKVAADACPYFSQWTYDSPLVISHKTNSQLCSIQKVMHKLIRYFVDHYDDYKHMMPVTDKVYRILSLCKEKPYRTGTYRTDFLIDENNHIKLIEITCRFALNGFFTSGFLNLLADRFLKDKPEIRKIDDYTPFYDYITGYFGEFKHVCLLKGTDNQNETKYLIPIFEKAGYPVHIIPADLVADNLHLLKDAAVIGELDHIELCNLPLKTIETLIESNLLNDLRTVFLIHDKRLFSILSNETFLKAVLTQAEIAEFTKTIVPTYSRLERPDLWSKAKAEKDNWIIKPRALGKGINVFAGCVTSEEQWRQVLSSDLIEDMILQPYITQRKIMGSVGNNQYNDFVVGTLLFFDDNFFGPGLFRASSYPITNKVDDRKIAPLVTTDIGYFNHEIIL